MIGIDLFSGAGGMTLGALRAGIDVKFAVEYDKYAALTYSHNNPKVTLFNDDIRKLKEIPVKKGKQQLVVFGGPPCQGFSNSNLKTRTLNNANNWLFYEFVKILDMMKPDFFVFENVKGFKGTHGGIFYEIVLEQFQKIGYTTSHFILNASEFGVPQNRERVFIVGSIDGKQLLRIPQSKSKNSVKDAIFDLPILRNGANQDAMYYRTAPQSEYSKLMRGNLKMSTNHLVSKNSNIVIERYKHIPQGGNWENIPDNMMSGYSNKNNCHSAIYHRLNYNKPSVTIGNYRKSMVIHPTQNRGLSVREAARLQSFPDSYQFLGSIGCQQQQVGDAVPPMLAKQIFKAILNI